MGLIKTAMMSGAAMYGINKISKAAVESRNNNNNTTSRHENSGRDYDQYYARPLESNNCQSDNRYLPSGRDMQNQTQYSTYYPNGPTQRLYLEGQAPQNGQQQYYAQDRLDSPPRYEYAGNTRSVSAPPLEFNHSPNGRRGYVEPEEVMGGPRESQGGNRTDMMSMLAQQAMSMGMMGSNTGQKDKKGKGDLIQSFLGR